MPKPLLSRLQPDSIYEFRAAATERFRDGVAADGQDRRTGAIYLWGYAVEMLLKAAYFQVSGFGPDQSITMRDLREAVRFGQNSQVLWPHQGQLHSVRAWAETLIALRLQKLVAHSDPAFEAQIVSRAQRLEPVWNETLRYHKNRAYPREVTQVRKTAEWYVVHSLVI